MNKAAIILTVATMLVSAAGCSQKSAPPSTHADAQVYLDTLKGMPADQRSAYMRAHPAGMQSVMASHDKNLTDQFHAMMSSSR